VKEVASSKQGFWTGVTLRICLPPDGKQTNPLMRREKMNYLTEMFVKFQLAMKSEKGQTLVEYALLLVLIAIVVIAMLTGIGGRANNAFSKVNSALS
jgi:pilus assembly protein Flp/PilA